MLTHPFVHVDFEGVGRPYDRLYVDGKEGTAAAAVAAIVIRTSSAGVSPDAFDLCYQSLIWFVFG
jgi:hypothetical protein